MAENIKHQTSAPRIARATIHCLCLLLLATTLYGTGGEDYEYPAKLSDTLDMLPGKSLGTIFLETSGVPVKEGPLDYEAPALDLANRLGKEPMPQLLKSADELIAQARLHSAESRDWCNLAHDIRDAVAASADNPDAARDYIRWRIKHLDLFGIVSDKKDGATTPTPVPTDQTDVTLDQHAETAHGAIKANWLYACGASRFKDGDRSNCQEWFDRVIKEFPNHPRAEAAMFLNARCAFSYSRSIADDDETGKVGARKKAVERFVAFRKRYPRGRFDADALGWLGALACDGGDYLKALDFYIAQAEVPGHPETLRTAIYNCEKALAHVAPKPNGDAAFNLIARHPRIAMAFTYLVLSAPEADNYDGKWDNPADVRKWRRTILPRIAAAVAKQKDAYKADDWHPRYLAMLVHAASNSGNHAQALQLSQVAQEQLAQSDDLLFARAVALQRAGKTREAIELLQTLLEKFPKSPLLPGARVRLALALQDNHQAGDAVAVLAELLPKPTPAPTPAATAPARKDDESDEKSEPDEATNKVSAEDSDALESRYSYEAVYQGDEIEWKVSQSAVFPNISGADEEQLHQLIDTLLNFAPLPELAAGLSNKTFNEIARADLRAILAERYLVAENFAEAKKYLTDSQAQHTVDHLAQLTSDNSGSAQEKAERMVQIGDAWVAARQQLLRIPLDTKLHLYERMFTIPGLTRRDNGRTLHLTDVEDQLDDRDELHHASRWWLRAARSVPGTPLAAKARLKALEALPQVARASSYAEQRAREIKLEAVSREIYDKLRSESPGSPEAQRFAAYWSLPPLPKRDGNDYIDALMPGEIADAPVVTCDDDSSALGYPFSGDDAFVENMRPSAEERLQGTPAEIASNVVALRHSQSKDEVIALAARLRKTISGPEDAAALNCLEDLAQFLSEPDVSSHAREVYANLRLDILHRARWAVPDPGISVKDDDESVSAEIDAAEKEPDLKSLQDYLSFCRIALVAGARYDVPMDVKDPKDPANPLTYISRDHAALEKMTREFLANYPKSHKREAAMFVLARSIYSLSCPFITCIGVPVPGTQPSDDVVDIVKKSYQREPLDPKRVLGALDDYDREFPNGRYAADVRNLRAATFWRIKEWDKALDLTLAQVADKTKADVQTEAETRLANIFAEIANVERRPDVLASIKSHPAAIPYLQAYLSTATKDRSHPLRYLQRYLSDQFHIKIPPPPEG